MSLGHGLLEQRSEALENLRASCLYPATIRRAPENSHNYERRTKHEILRSTLTLSQLLD
jgi:hypothetical protein